MQNRVYVICIYVYMYVCMDCTSARGNFFLQKHGFLGLTPLYSETTALSKPYFILKRRSERKFLQKRLLFKKQKVDSTGYYGIEDPFPDLISKLRRFMGGYGVPVVAVSLATLASQLFDILIFQKHATD